MGVGLLQRYKHCSTDDIPDLETEIRDQIVVYLPEYQDATVTISVENSIMKIAVSIDSTLYQFTTSDQPAEDEMSLSGLK
jgi:anion-transporting  ArsA/GET3 family ATPase